jgi:protein SCO1
MLQHNSGHETPISIGGLVRSIFIMWKPLPACLLALALLLSSCGAPGVARVPAGGSEDDYRGTVVDPPKTLSGFTLTSHTGQPMSLEDLRGRPALFFFGYTNCPDVCPITMGEWKQVKASLGAEAEKVSFVFISVDGERDTPEALTTFLGRFDPAFIGLTGDDADLQAVAKDFGIFYKVHDHETGEESFLVDHSPPSFLIDGEGRMAKVYSYGIEPDVIVEDLRQLVS